MKITQRMIDQAAMIASAKVGQQLQTKWKNYGWVDVTDKHVALDDGDYAYRLKPEPRTIWVNEYEDEDCAHRSAERARHAGGACDPTRIAVEYREVIK